MIFLPVLTYIKCHKLTKKVKHIQSDLSGLNRKITLLNCDGDVIRSWEGNFMIELIGNSASWIDDNNKEVKISVTFVIEEL